MISPEILNSLKSNFQDPSYSVIISNFEQTEFCNKDQLKIYVEQYNPNLEKIIENKENIIEDLKKLLDINNIEIPDLYELKVNSCIQKTLVIDSVLDHNMKDGLFISKLNGSMDNDVEKNIINRYLDGTIIGKTKQINITTLDYPNYFNKTRFRIKQNQLIISIPKKISSIRLTLTNNSTNQSIVYTSENIENGKLTIPNLSLTDTDTYTFDIRYQITESLINQNIESITTPLSSQIQINFAEKYKQIPAIIPTIDEDDKVYSSYTTKFERDEDNNYIGVTITFSELKRQKTYGDINITIIGIQVSD